MTIKKQFVDVVEFLEANKNKKVSTILDEIISMTSGKNVEAKTFHKDEHGTVIAIRCYYYKKWMHVDDVEFGRKASTASGYNTMCKKGVSNWTKQQRVAKQAKELLLEQLASGEFDASDLPAKLDEVEQARKAINLEDAPVGYDTLEECLEF